MKFLSRAGRSSRKSELKLYRGGATGASYMRVGTITCTRNKLGANPLRRLVRSRSVEKHRGTMRWR